MKDKEYISGLLDTALQAIEADQIEVSFHNQEMAVTRFANSIIHQNLVKEVDTFWARVILGKKIGGISIGSADKEVIREGMRTAYKLTGFQKEDPHFYSLPKAVPIEEIEEFYPVSSDERAECVEKIVKIAKQHNLTAAGVIYNIWNTLGIANSLGVKSIGNTAYAVVEVILMSDDSSGLATHTAKQFSEINCESLAEIAAEKVLMGKNPVEIPTGRYTVLLEPRAVAELIGFLAYIGLGARAYQEGTSFMKGKIGKKITGDNITIIDDAYHPNAIGFRFDYEGIPKQKVILIENGVARSVVYDSYYANKEGKKSTGHATPQPNPWGPYPMHLVLTPGESTIDEMLSSITDGLLITRFWYTRVVDPDKTLVTGMTRDGTFLVKNGKIAQGIKNMRYTINILEALNNVCMVSKECKSISSYVVPTLLIKDFNFTAQLTE